MIVEKKYHQISKLFTTQSGIVLKNCVMAYEEYGNIKKPVIYICHGAFSNFHAAGFYKKPDSFAGFWNNLIGPGKVLDTNKFRIISANSLGSMFGSTSPLSINPKTGKIYGSEFPEITIIDMVNFHKLFLDDLKINQLFMLAGFSMGGMQALQMASLYPKFMKSVFGVAAGGRMTPYVLAMHYFMLELLKKDENFNNGNYKSNKDLKSSKTFSLFSKLIYSHEEFFNDLCKKESPYYLNSKECLDNISSYFNFMLEDFLKNFDANCVIRIIEAMNSFNLGSNNKSFESGVLKIKCPTLLINFNTDMLFKFLSIKEIEKIINLERPGQVVAREKKSKKGHFACIFDSGLFENDLKNFVEKLKHEIK